MIKLLLIVFFISIPPLRAQEEKMDSLEKSLIFPGWGQISEGRYFEGVFFATSELICIGGILKNLREGNKYYKLYKKAENTPDAVKFRDLTIKFDKRRNRFIAGAVTVWALNLLDMSLNRRKKNSVILKFGGDSIGISFKKEF